MHASLKKAAEKLANSCERYNLSESFASKSELTKSLETFRDEIKTLLETKGKEASEKEKIVIWAAQQLIVFPVIKRTLSEKQIEALFPHERSGGA